MSPSITDWMTAIGTVTTGALAILLGVFGPGLRGLFFRPNLEPTIQMLSPDCHKLKQKREDGTFHQGYYCRINVTNRGNVSAREVEVRLRSVQRLGADGVYNDDPNFRPLNLRWSHLLTIVMPKIDPQLAKYCDLCHVWQDSSSHLAFDTEVEPLEVSPGVWPTRKGRGQYLIEIVVSATNARPVPKSFKIDYTGEWLEETERMFKEGLVISEA